MKKYSRPSKHKLIIATHPAKIYIPDFVAENELYRKCGTMNIVDAGIMVPGMDEVASLELKSIDSEPVFSTSGIPDEDLAHSVLPRQMDDNEIYEQLDRDMRKENKNG